MKPHRGFTLLTALHVLWICEYSVPKNVHINICNVKILVSGYNKIKCPSLDHKTGNPLCIVTQCDPILF